MMVICMGATWAAPLLCPQPQKQCWTGKTLLLSGPVRIVAENPAEARKWAREAGLALTDARKAPTSLLLRLEPDQKLLGQEGYRLEVSLQEGRVLIQVEALTETGLFYALQTLRQLTERRAGGLELPLGKLEDWPGLAVRGIKGQMWPVEGYYPIIEWMPSVKLNFLMTCYSLWPETWLAWRNPLSQEQKAHLKRLSEEGRARHVRLCFAVNPSINARPTLEYSSEAEVDRLFSKYADCYAAGIRSFAVCLDDISFEMEHATDRARYATLAEAQADFMIRLLKRLDTLEPGLEVLFCPTIYSTAHVTSPESLDYITTIGRLLPSRIEVFWTGPGVISGPISAQDARAFGDWIGRKPFIWDNYPVNDYCAYRPWLAPVQDRATDLLGELSGYLANPMRQAEASKLALGTIADYLWNPTGYEPARSQLTVLRAYSDGKGYGALKRLAQLYPEFPGQPSSVAPEPDQLGALIRRLARTEGLEALSGDLASLLEGWLQRVLRERLVKQWQPSGQAFEGWELTGGGIDYFGPGKNDDAGANWIYAASTPASRMAGRFACEQAPKGNWQLELLAKDDDFAIRCPVSITLNGTLLFEGTTDVPDGGWGSLEVAVPEGLIRAGNNELEIENIATEGVLGMPPWFMVKRLELRPADGP